MNRERLEAITHMEPVGKDHPNKVDQVLAVELLKLLDRVEALEQGREVYDRRLDYLSARVDTLERKGSIPNATTLAAIRSVERGDVVTATDAADLIVRLNAADTLTPAPPITRLAEMQQDLPPEVAQVINDRWADLATPDPAPPADALEAAREVCAMNFPTRLEDPMCRALDCSNRINLIARHLDAWAKAREGEEVRRLREALEEMVDVAARNDDTATLPATPGELERARDALGQGR